MGVNTPTAEKSSSVELLLSTLESERQRLFRNLYALQDLNDKLESEPREEEIGNPQGDGYSGHIEYLQTEVTKIQYANTFFETQLEKLKRHI